MGEKKMVSKLKAINPKQALPQKPKILIFGKPGYGKTFTSLDFPNVYFIDTEGGASLPHYREKLTKSGGSYLGQEQGSMDFETIIEQVKALATEKHDFKTIVIDSISKVFNMYITDEMERLGDKDQFGASKKKPVSAMKRLISWLERVDMNVILIAHEKTEWGIVNGQRQEVGSTFDAWDKLGHELDLCLNIIKSGPNRNARVTKSRLIGFPDGEIFPWSYKAFAEKYGKDIIEKKAEQITLATDDQLKEIKHLLNTVKLPDGQEEKWLKGAQVDGWEEMTSDRIANAIEHIKKTYLTTKG